MVLIAVMCRLISIGIINGSDRYFENVPTFRGVFFSNLPVIHVLTIVKFNVYIVMSDIQPVVQAARIIYRLIVLLHATQVLKFVIANM